MVNTFVGRNVRLALITLTFSLIAVACGKSESSSSSSELSAIADRNVYPLCPAVGQGAQFGGEVWRPGNPQVSANGLYYFYWFKATTDRNKARGICDLTNFTAGQLAQQGGCSCLRRK